MGIRQFVKDTLWWLNVRTVYKRITLTRVTTLYFLLAVASCVLQVSFQVATLSTNSQSIGITSTILTQGAIPMGFPIIEDNSLQFCDSIPGQDGTLCVLVAGHPTKNFSMNFNPQTDRKQDESKSHQKISRSFASIAKFNSAGNLTSIQVSGMPGLNGKLVDIHGRCALSLTWLSDRLGDAEREDVVTLAFQVWLLGLSLVAILNESIPHLFAVLASHALDTIWAGVRLSSNANLRSEYEQFIVNDACSGVDIYSSLWNMRGSLAIGLLSVNLVTFCTLVYLSVALYKVYHAQTLKHFGTSVRVNMVYMSILALSIFLQMAGFFVLASTALWIDKVSSGSISHVAKHLTYYQIAFVATAILEIPWLTLGWISVRREKRALFIGFSIFGAILVVIESLMFTSALYRFVFSTWSFFAMMTVFAYILLVSTVILGFLCRIQFGRGLVDYLTIEEKVEGPEFETIANGAQEKVSVQEADPEMDFRLTQFIITNPKSNAVSIVAPPNAVVRKGDSSAQWKSMLRRFSGKSGQTAVSFADTDSRRGYPSPAPTEGTSVVFNDNPSPVQGTGSLKPS